MRTLDMHMKAALRIAALAAGLCLLPLAAAADVLVIASDVPEIRAESELKADQTIRIGPGQQITLLLPSGEYKTVPGPFDGRVESLYRNPGFFHRVYEIVKELWTTGGSDDSEAIGVRMLPFPQATPDWRAIRLQKGAPDSVYCYETGARPILTHSEQLGIELLRVIGQAGASGEAAAEWPRGAATLDWPAGMAVVDGGRYMLTLADMTLNVTLRQIPAGSLSDGNVLKTLGEAECRMQIAAWLESQADAR